MANKATIATPQNVAATDYIPQQGRDLSDPVVVNQIYSLVNSVFNQMTGRTDITVTDSKSLVAMGNEVDSLGKNDLYLNSLARRIGLTIDDYRVYENDFSHFKRDSFTYGALVQKLHTEMPEAVEDVAYNVGAMDGQSVDHYVISNPKVKQKIFDVVTPYSFFITIQDYLLQEAFSSSSGMYSLINSIFGQCQNKMEVVHEDLGRLAMSNLFVNLKPVQVYNLVTAYNNAKNATLTSSDALYNPDFLRFAIGVMNNVSRKMTKMSVVYNAEGQNRHTPYAKQNMFMLSDFETQLETVVLWQAFQDQYLKLQNFVPVPYWQAIKDGTKINDWSTVSKVILNNSEGAQTIIPNIVATIIDWDAFGTFRQMKRVATTPVNARALYYNTFWHERQMWFNDLGENVVLFTLN